MKAGHLLFGALIGLLAAPGPLRSAALSEDGAPVELQAAIQEAAAAVTPALVRLHVVEVGYRSGREVKSEFTGSGVILTGEGHIVTNHHVAGNAKQIVCTLASKEEFDAELVGTDPLTDICVIKLRLPAGREAPAARFADSSRVEVGDRVLAMGSPLALSQSVTMGIVSNTELVMPDLYWPFRFEVEGEDVGSVVKWIGHDAVIYPGNSGGPLVNLRGEVVGINEMQFGLGGAIPSNLVQEVAHRLISDAKITRAWLGLEVQPLLKLSARETGVLVSGTIPGSPAAEAGFRPGDILLSLAGQAVTVRFPEELPIFNQLVADLGVGEEVAASVMRAGDEIALSVTPAERELLRPREREFPKWGMTGRNLSLLEARQMRRESRDGVLVTSLRSGGPCDDAKPRVLERDVIVAVGDSPVRNVDELADLTEKATEEKPGPVAVLASFDRRAERYLAVVQLGKEPLPDPAREARKAWLGVATQVLTKELAEALGLGEATGVRLTQIFPDAPAAEAGLRVGDLITALDAQRVAASRPEHFDVFPAMIRQYRIGSEVEVTLVRDGEELKLAAKLGASPPEPREMDKYRDDSFELTVRDVALSDLAQQRWQEAEQGPVVEAVSEGSWAALGHLAVGDLLLEVAGRRTPDVAAVQEAMVNLAAERPQTVVLRVRRGIHNLYLELKPKWPEAG